MKLTFVIPAHNEELYIGKCLESIEKQAQKYGSEIEIVVVNNCSTDSTAQVASSFSGVRVVDEPQKGLTFARQAGFLASHGELVANVDADTILTPGWLDYVISEFQRNPKLIALSGPFVYYDLSKPERLFVNLFYAFAYFAYVLNRFVFRVNSMLQGGNFIIRRAALEKVGGFNLGFSFYGEDAEIARRLNQIGPVKYTMKLKIYTSARRLRHEGLVKMGLKYAMNYFWTTLFKRPFTKQYLDIRPK